MFEARRLMAARASQIREPGPLALGPSWLVPLAPEAPPPAYLVAKVNKLRQMKESGR